MSSSSAVRFFDQAGVGSIILHRRTELRMNQQTLVALLGWKSNSTYKISDIERGKERDLECNLVNEITHQLTMELPDRFLALRAAGCLPSEEELQERVEQEKSWLENILLPAYLEDFTGRILFANAPALGILAFAGLDINQIRPHWFDIIFGHEFTLPEWQKELRRYLAFFKWEKGRHLELNWFQNFMRKHQLFRDRGFLKLWSEIHPAAASGIAEILFTNRWDTKLPVISADQTVQLRDFFFMTEPLNEDPRFVARIWFDTEKLNTVKA